MTNDDRGIVTDSPSADAGSADTPLAGIVVADFSRVLAGPLATMTLADLGATVIKVERPGVGDETRTWGPPWTADSSTYYQSVNRTKRSLALDLTDADDLTVARELVARADVLIENFKPGTMQRLGLDHDTVSVDNPGLVYCSITGFGSAPGGREMLGYDFVVQAVGGLMSITGFPDGEPTKVGVALVDVITGKDAVIGILAALNGRDRTGRGDRIEVSLLSSLLGGLVNQGQAALHTGDPGQRLGNRHPSITPYETFDCSDGVIAVACGNDGQFARLTEALGIADVARDPDYRTNPARIAHRDTLIPILQARLRAAPAEQWVDVLAEAGVPAGKVNSILQAVELADRIGLDPTIDVGAGRQIRHPVRWTSYRTASPAVPPTVGQHDDEIRAWLAAPPTAPPAAAHDARATRTDRTHSNSRPAQHTPEGHQ